MSKPVQNKRINDLKALLAEKRISPKSFFEDYYQRYSIKDYKEFLKDLNTYDVYTLAIKKADEALRKSLGMSMDK
jgi:replicative superfamily II helicase